MSLFRTAKHQGVPDLELTIITTSAMSNIQTPKM
jgi:hypothetical protein